MSNGMPIFYRIMSIAPNKKAGRENSSGFRINLKTV
jgi:hypothetical protein